MPCNSPSIQILYEVMGAPILSGGLHWIAMVVTFEKSGSNAARRAGSGREGGCGAPVVKAAFADHAPHPMLLAARTATVTFVSGAKLLSMICGPGLPLVTYSSWPLPPVS